jgi:hypothetical protein
LARQMPRFFLTGLRWSAMSKRFKGLDCAYCSDRPSVTGDHVFAREFFLKTQRADLPQVPTCNQCNGEKSKLEHYLTAVLPFGGRHPDALTNLSAMVEPRLAKNKKLHRRLSQNSSKVWARTESGLHALSTALPFEPERLVELFNYIVRGVLFYHWSVRLTTEHFSEVVLLASDGQKIFGRFMQMRAKARINVNLGNGTIIYDGIQGTDSDNISVWRFSIYGGLTLTSPGEESVQIGALTGPKRVSERTALYAKWIAGKGPWLGSH